MLLFVSGCGGGGGSNPAQADTVSGMAAAGAVIVGDVYLKDSAATPKILSKGTTDGTYSFDVTGMTKPFFLKVVGTAGVTPFTLYSLAADKGTANINPMTDLVVACAAAAAGAGSDLAAIYAAPSGSAVQSVSGQLAQAVLDVQATLKTILQDYQADKVNPISDGYQADHTGIDGMFDALDFQLAGSVVTITAKDTATEVFSADLATGFTTFAVSGRVTSAGAGLAGVTVRVEDAETGAIYGSMDTEAGGSYLIRGIPNGSYKVVPSRSGFIFDRANTALTVLGDSAVPDFTASAVAPPTPGGTGGVTVTF